MADTVMGYHATSKSYANEIRKTNKFKLIPFNRKSLKFTSRVSSTMPGDLGSGIYFFIKSENNLYVDPEKLAKRYYVAHKRNNYGQNYVVLKCVIDIDDNTYTVLDMNNLSNIKTFNDVRENESANIKRILKDNITSINAKKRMNVDGIITEMLIEKLSKKDIEVDAVLKDSFTEIDEYRSKVNNGRELCIRNHDMILSIT